MANYRSGPAPKITGNPQGRKGGGGASWPKALCIIFVTIKRLALKKYVFLFFAFLPYCLSAQTHKDSIGLPDSTLKEMHALLQESEALRIRDSIRAALLYDELNATKSPSVAKQQELQAELDRVRDQDSLRTMQQRQAIDALRNKTPGRPVTLFYDTLFVIYAPLGSFSSLQRADDARSRIKALYEDPFFDPDSLTIKHQYGLLNVCYGKENITSISHVDGLWINGPTDSLARAYRQKIEDQVLYFKMEYSARNVWKRIGYVIVALTLLLLGTLLLRRAFAKMEHWLSARSIALSKGIRLRNYQLFTPEYIFSALKQIVAIARTLVVLLYIYFTITFIFSIFPSTHSWTDTLIGWVVQPVKKILRSTLDYLPNLITILVVLIVVRVVLRLFRFFTIEVERGILNLRGFHKEWARPTYNIIRFLVFAFAFVIIFPYLPGSESDAFKGVSVFLGILLSIGSSSAISNTIAGLVITYMRPFKVGDWIKVNDIIGQVMEKTALVTRMRTIHNEDVTVPNSTIMANHTINYSSCGNEPGLILHATVTIGYGVPWPKVHGLLVAAAKSTPDVDLEKEPFVFQKSLDDFYITYEINVFTKKPEKMYFITSALYEQIQNHFDEAGVEIMSPQQVQLRKQKS